MKTHRRILHVVVPARTVPVEGLTGALEADPLVLKAIEYLPEAKDLLGKAPRRVAQQ